MASEASERPGGADDTLTSETGEILAGRYRLGAKIGSGSTGIVYRADDLMFSRPVAVRFLTPTLSREEDAEGRLEARLHHGARMMRDDVRALSDIVDIIDLGRTDGGQIFVVTELLTGETLADVLARDGVLRWQALRPIIVRACQIVHLSHEHGLVRQDLQTRNLYPIRDKNKAGVVRIFSPGLGVAFGARLWAGLDPHESLMLARYAAPEQISGGAVDRRTDVYALGVILYECLTGQVPFTDPRPAHVLAAQLLSAPPPFPPEARRRGVPAELEAIVLRALAKGPDDRWPTVKALANAMAAIEFGRCDASGVLESSDIADMTDHLEPALSATTMRVDRSRLSGKPGLAPVAAVDPAASTSEMAWREILDAAESAVGAIAQRADDRADVTPSHSSISSITRSEETAPDDSTPTLPFAPAEHSAPRWPHPAPAQPVALAPRRGARTWAIAAGLAVVTAAGVAYSLRPTSTTSPTALTTTRLPPRPAPQPPAAPLAAPSAPLAAPSGPPPAPAVALEPAHPPSPEAAMAEPTPSEPTPSEPTPSEPTPSDPGEPPTAVKAPADPPVEPVATPVDPAPTRTHARPTAAPRPTAPRPRRTEPTAETPAPAGPRKQAPGASRTDPSEHELPDPGAPRATDPP